MNFTSICVPQPRACGQSSAARQSSLIRSVRPAGGRIDAAGRFKEVRNALSLILLLAMPLPGQDVRRRIVVELGAFPSPAAGSRLLWIGAHPDDEVLVAPLLGTLCVEQGVRCSFLILTRGEKGECLLAGGCGDLAAIRSAEMASAASFYGADLTLWDYPDAALQVDPDLVLRLASLIASMDPDVILTLDPRHGSTCHADHKILGSLVLEAVARVQDQPVVYLAENHVDIRDGGASIRFSSVFSRPALVFRGDWDNLLQNAAIHASQFGPTQLEALRTIPSQQRTLLFLPVTPGTVLDPLQICASPKIK